MAVAAHESARIAKKKRLSVTISVNGVGLKQAGQTKAGLSRTALLRIGDSNYRLPVPLSVRHTYEIKVF
jgi:hypothetical protein